MRGSLIISFDELITDRYVDGYTIFVNGDQRNNEWLDSTELYSTYLYEGDVVQVYLFDESTTAYGYNVYRRDYTNNDAIGDMGITNTLVTTTPIITGSTLNGFEFTIPSLPNDYNFEYRITASNVPTPTPTPTMTPTATATPTPTPTPLPEFTIQWVYNYTGATEAINVTGFTEFSTPGLSFANTSLVATGLTGTGTISGSTTYNDWYYFEPNNNPWFEIARRRICKTGTGDLQITGVTAYMYLNNVLTYIGDYEPAIPFNLDYTVDNCPTLCVRCNQAGPNNFAHNIQNGDVVRIVWNDQFSNVVPPPVPPVTGSTFEYIHTWDNAPPTHSVSLLVGGTGGGWDTYLMNGVQMYGQSGSYTGSTFISGSLDGNPYAYLTACSSTTNTTASAVTMSKYDNNVLTQSVSGSNKNISLCPTTSSLLTMVGGSNPYNHQFRYDTSITYATVQPFWRHVYAFFNAGAIAKTFYLAFTVNSGTENGYTSSRNTATGTITSPLTQYGNFTGTNKIIKAIIGVCKSSGSLTRDDVSVTLTRNGSTIQTLSDSTDTIIKTCGGTPYYTIKEFTFSAIDIYNGDQFQFNWTDNFK
jgi:hypothetical protein